MEDDQNIFQVLADLSSSSSSSDSSSSPISPISPPSPDLSVSSSKKIQSCISYKNIFIIQQGVQSFPALIPSPQDFRKCFRCGYATHYQKFCPLQFCTRCQHFGHHPSLHSRRKVF